MKLLIAAIFAALAFGQVGPIPSGPSPYLGPLAPDPKAIGYDPTKPTNIVHMPEQTKPSIKPTSVVRDRHYAIIDPQIPGIEIARTSPTEFDIRNRSTKTIVGIAVAWERGSGRGYALMLDGVTTLVDVAPLDVIHCSPNELLTDRGDSVRAGEDTDGITMASIEFLVFDDGQFYGPDYRASEIREKLRVRRQLYKEATQSGENIATFMQHVAACHENPACRNASGLTSNDSFLRADAATDYLGLLQYQRIEQSVLLARLKSLTDRHPGIRRTIPLRTAKEAAVHPENSMDGWYAFELTGNCGNGSPGYGVSLINQTGCIFPANYYEQAGSPPGPLGGAAINLVPASTGGFTANYQFACTKYIQGQIQPVGNAYGRFLTTQKTKFTNDNAILEQAPRANIYANFTANWPNLSNSTWLGPDTFTFKTLAGLVEPYNASAPNPDGGSTSCAVDWFQMNTPFGLLASEDLYGVYGAVNSISQAGNYVWGLPYGYPLSNRITTDYCDPTRFPTTTTFNTVAVKRFNGVAIASCTHFAPQANNQCNPFQDWCCCMAAYGDWELCESYGLTPNDNCSTAGGALSLGSNPPSVAAPVHSDNVPDRIGLWRNDGSNALLLDSPGIGTYVAGVTKYSTSFTPPGGVQSGDQAVSGNWTGSGSRSCAGFYRQSTGEWFLDANCNGTYDGPQGGDYHYTFGGLAGDVAVVGPWLGGPQAGSQDCVGIFRQGFSWLIDSNCDGAWENGIDNFFGFGGQVGDVPVIGRWAGVQAQVGVVRCYVAPGTNYCGGGPFLWIMDGTTATDTSQADHVPGQGMGCPYPDPQYQIQCLTPSPFAFGGLYGDLPVAGDWNGSGRSTAGVFRNYGQFWMIDMDGTQQNPLVYTFGGTPNDHPLVGKW